MPVHGRNAAKQAAKDEKFLNAKAKAEARCTAAEAATESWKERALNAEKLLEDIQNKNSLIDDCVKCMSTKAACAR